MGLLKVSVFETFDPASIERYDPEIIERRLKTVLALRRNDTHALVYLGIANRNVDVVAEEMYYNKALKADPDNALAYFLKGHLFARKGQGDEAMRMYEQAIERSPWNQIFLNNLAYEHYLRADYRRAADRYRQLLNLDPRLYVGYCYALRTAS